MKTDPDVAEAASWFAHPSRAAILLALSDGRALPAGELARIAGVTAATGSAHLQRLVSAGLLAPVSSGRHRYFRIARDEVGEIVEALARVAPRPLPLTGPRRVFSEQLAFARTCYGHLAGVVGVGVSEALVGRGQVRRHGDGHELTATGRDWLVGLGLDEERLRRAGPTLKFCPVDWSERRPHLAGQVGRWLAEVLIDRGWFRRVRDSRALRLTPEGRRGLESELGWRPPT